MPICSTRASSRLLTLSRVAFAACVVFGSSELGAQLRVVSTVSGAQSVRIFAQHGRNLALTADGRLWCLMHFNDGLSRGDASLSLRLLSSGDGGRTWQAETRMREVGALRGSLATDVDGRTLHFVYEARQNRGHSSIAHETYDVRAKTWGPKATMLASSTTTNDQYLVPTIDVARDGTLVACYYTHRTRQWSGQMRIKRGGNWTAQARVNVDTYGVRIDHQVVGDDVWFAYRTATGGYGIRARRYDLAARAWGREGELQVSGANAALVGTANNSSCLAVKSDGTVFVLWSSGNSTAGAGALWLSRKAPSATGFSLHSKVDDDAPVLGGNRTYEHFTLSVEADTPLVFYAPLRLQRSELLLRIPTPTGVSPALRMSKTANDVFGRLSGLRSDTVRSPGYVLAEQADGKAVRIFTRGSGEASVRHVMGCGTQSLPTPDLRAADVPQLGKTLNFEFSSMGATRAAVFFLGVDAQRFGQLALPLELTGFGFPNCYLAQAPLVSAVLQSRADGTASVPFAYPSLASLSGVPLYWQALTLAPGANPGGALWTNGLATIAR